jgi:hypothetical protein
MAWSLLPSGLSHEKTIWLIIGKFAILASKFPTAGALEKNNFKSLANPWAD